MSETEINNFRGFHPGSSDTSQWSCLSCHTPVTCSPLWQSHWQWGRTGGADSASVTQSAYGPCFKKNPTLNPHWRGEIHPAVCGVTSWLFLSLTFNPKTCQHSWLEREFPAFHSFIQLLLSPDSPLIFISGPVIFKKTLKHIHPSLCGWFDPKMLHEILWLQVTRTHTDRQQVSVWHMLMKSISSVI